MRRKGDEVRLNRRVAADDLYPGSARIEVFYVYAMRTCDSSNSQWWWPRVDPESVLGYLLARQKPTGGFGLTLRLPPTLEDTYYAVRALELLEATTRVNPLGDYLNGVPVSATSPIKVLLQQAYLRRRSGSPIEGLEEAVLVRLHRRPSLAELYWALRVARELGGGSKERLSAAIWEVSESRLASWRTVTDFWQLLVLREFRRLPAPADALTWALSCQNLDGGFGFLPGSTSFLENTIYGLRVVAHLGGRLRWPERCGEYVLRCRSTSGGFGRTSSALPSPETTYMALASLRLLDKLEREPASHEGVAPESRCPSVEEPPWRPTHS
jgi:hypothetical protein